jgi:hypothetical protein
MGFKNTRTFVDSINESSKITSWRKQPTQATGGGIWFDLSMSPGNPSPNYYIGVPNVFTLMKQSTDGGIPHCSNLATATEHIHRITMLTVTAAAVPLPVYFLDYLGFYPFVDESVVDEQFMDNTVAITRYTNGKGVRIMPLVVAGHSGVAGVNFTVKYTNAAGVTGRITQNHTLSSQVVNGTVASSATTAANGYSCAPFMALQTGDDGVRAIESVTFQGAGDVGLIAFVLVKPLATLVIRGIDAPVEMEYFKDMNTAPQIIQDAYINAICYPSGSLSGAPIHGLFETAWS